MPTSSFFKTASKPVFLAYRISRDAGKLIRQNFVIAIGYNVVALPVAILGHATPFVAAMAMSLSSIVVVANALRLKGEPMQAKDKAFGLQGCSWSDWRNERVLLPDPNFA